MPDRIIKESVCASDTIDKLSWFEEVFFYRLLVNCDDYGRFDARPKILKNRLFPLKDDLTTKAVEAALSTLSTVGLVQVYEYDHKPYLQLTTWERYQRIRAKRSKFPQPDAPCGHLPSSAIKCPRNPIQSESNPIQRDIARTREEIPEVTEDGRNILSGLSMIYEQTKGSPLPAAMATELQFRIAEGFDPELLKEALRRSIGKGSEPAYFARVLQNWTAEGIKTAESLRKREGTQKQNPPDYSDPSRYEQEEELPEWAKPQS